MYIQQYFSPSGSHMPIFVKICNSLLSKFRCQNLWRAILRLVMPRIGKLNSFDRISDIPKQKPLHVLTLWNIVVLKCVTLALVKNFFEKWLTHKMLFHLYRYVIQNSEFAIVYYCIFETTLFTYKWFQAKKNISINLSLWIIFMHFWALMWFPIENSHKKTNK